MLVHEQFNIEQTELPKQRSQKRGKTCCGCDTDGI